MNDTAATDGTPQTTRIRDPYLIVRLGVEMGRRGHISLSSTAEQLLIERLVQVECLSDKEFERVYGQKVKERHLMQSRIKEAAAKENTALKAEVKALKEQLAAARARNADDDAVIAKLREQYWEMKNAEAASKGQGLMR
jgi:uncharacterized protein YlxW (UPF0749 family)